MHEAADSKKARDIVTIDLRDRSSMADYFVICEGDTDRQTRSIAEAIREAAHKHGLAPLHASGEREGAWILLDYVVVVVHIFLPGERAFYDLETLWAATSDRRVAASRPRATRPRQSA